MSELKEGHYVYTDLGIERVHWCIVNGEKELVTPKGYILGDVPNYELEVQTVKRNMILTLENAELKNTLAKTKANGKYPDRISRLKSRVVALSEENTKLKELLKECLYYIGYDTYEFDEKVHKLLTKINQVLGEE